MDHTITWRQFIDKLAEDGVTYDAVEDVAIDEDGVRRYIHMLVRYDPATRRMLRYPTAPPPEQLTDPVSWIERRRIAIRLGLDHTRYILEREEDAGG